MKRIIFLFSAISFVSALLAFQKDKAVSLEKSSPVEQGSFKGLTAAITLTVTCLTNRTQAPGGSFRHKLKLMKGKVPIPSAQVKINDPIGRVCTQVTTDSNGEAIWIRAVPVDVRQMCFVIEFFYGDLKQFSSISIASSNDKILLPSYALALETMDVLTSPMLVWPSRGGFQDIKEDVQTMLRETGKVGIAMIHDYWSNPVNKAKTVLMVGSCVAVPLTFGATTPVCLALVGSVAVDLISSDLKLLTYKIIDATNESTSTKLALKNMVDLTSIGISVTTLDPSEGIVSDVDALASEVDFANNASSQIIYYNGAVQGASISAQRRGRNTVYLFTIYKRVSSIQPALIKSKDPNCKTNNDGDYCFQNNTNLDLGVTLSSSRSKVSNVSMFTCTLQPGQKQCFYDVGAGSARYEIKTPSGITINGYNNSNVQNNSNNQLKEFYSQGSLYIDACAENSFIINIEKPSYSTNDPQANNINGIQKSKDPDCKQNNNGDYFFQNNTNVDLDITLSSSPGKVSNVSFFTCTLQAGQKQWFYSVPAGPARYEIKSRATAQVYYYNNRDEQNNSKNEVKDFYSQGALYIDACTQNGFVINLNEPSYSTNAPSTENSDSKKSKDPNCEPDNIGDYCFQNDTKLDLSVTLSSSPGKVSNVSFFTCTLQPGQKQWFYNVPSGPARYEIKSPAGITINGYGAGSTPKESVPKPYFANGSLYVESCKENVFAIK